MGGVVTYAGITFRKHGLRTAVASNIVEHGLKLTKFYAFTDDEDQAIAKLETALGRAPQVCSALSRFLEANYVTLVIGNHDVELSLPRVRSRLVDLLGCSRKSIDFVVDGEAYRIGRVLVEHGNRYDGWNIVDHGGLRTLRSAKSRYENYDWDDIYQCSAGSYLVANVINPLKGQFKFINLLKPEGVVVPLILRVLRPKLGTLLKHAWQLAVAAVKGEISRVDEGYPRKSGDIARHLDLNLSTHEMSALAEEITELSSSAGQLSSKPVDLIRQLATKDETLQLTDRDLKKLLILLRRSTHNTNGVPREVLKDNYRVAAERLLRNSGLDLVVFGHTHDPLRVRFEGGLYINTGTWTHTLSIPGECLADTTEGFEKFRAFVESMLSGTFEDHAFAKLTYADIRLGTDGEVETAHLREFGKSGQEQN